jgi:hypothetical protein
MQKRTKTEPSTVASFTFMNTTPPPLRFTLAESEAAHKAWKASCGPHSIAAACGMTLDTVRSSLEGYKGWMNPTQVTAVLRDQRRPFELKTQLKTDVLCEGINRIQWEGPWLKPCAPPRLAYFHTHYVAHRNGWVLCTACLSAEWIRVEDWRNHHLTVEPVSPFHITHHWILS